MRKNATNEKNATDALLSTYDRRLIPRRQQIQQLAAQLVALLHSTCLHTCTALAANQVLTPKHAFFVFTYASKNAFHYEITGYRKRHTEFSDFRRSLKRKRTLPWISNGLLLFCTRQRRRETMSRSWLHSWSTFYQGWNTNALGVADTRW